MFRTERLSPGREDDMEGCFLAQRLASVSRAVTTEGTPYNMERRTGVGEESEKYNLMSTTNRLKRKVSFAQRR